MRKIFLITGLALVMFSCEELAEEETPFCKTCYEVTYNNATNEAMDTNYPFNMKVCGGDILNWKTIEDEVTDSTTLKHECD